MKRDDIVEILRLHGMYLRNESGGVRADLRGADLRGADLSGADLRGANFRGANFSEADLSGADLRGADLRGANFRGANFRGANFSEADLSEANLSGANLSGANLSVANLSGAIDGRVARLDFGGWSICVRSAVTSIGCQSHANNSWLAWSPESPEIAAMHGDAPEWWRVHGEAVKGVIRCVMAKCA